MEGATRQVQILRAYGNKPAENRQDEVLEESFLALELDGEEECTVSLTPGNEVDWALGHLAGRRLILSMDEVREVVHEPGRVRVFRRVFREAIPLKERWTHTASSAMPGENRGGEAWPDPLPVEWSLPFSSILRAVEDLARGPLFIRTGCVHVALLGSVPSGEGLVLAEDVGRHNALDKAAGWAIRRGVDLTACFMATSGRLPADMVCKAFGLRIPLLASVSAATASGVDAAMRGGITLIGFAREGRMNVYSVPERIEGLKAP